MRFFQKKFVPLQGLSGVSGNAELLFKAYIRYRPYSL